VGSDVITGSDVVAGMSSDVDRGISDGGGGGWAEIRPPPPTLKILQPKPLALQPLKADGKRSELLFWPV
jgi:hypothetical protein